MSTNPKYLYVHDWREWQSYRADRGQPPWIKAQRSLLRHPKWVQLSDIEKGQVFSIWLLAADNDGRLLNDAEYIRKACGIENKIDLNRLISLDLLDAKLTPTRRQHDANMTPQKQRQRQRKSREESTLCVPEKKSGDAPRKKSSYPEAFEAFWQPINTEKLFHRTGPGTKREAFNEWQRHAKEHPPDWLLDRWRGYVAFCRRTDTHTKHVCRWLKYEGFEQEAPEPVKVGEQVDEALRQKWQRDEEKEHAGKQAGNPRNGHPSLGDRVQAAQIEGPGTDRVRGNGRYDRDDDLREKPRHPNSDLGDAEF